MVKSIRYVKGDSALHRLNPMSKLCAVAVCTIGIFVVRSVALQALGLVLILATDSRLGSRRLLPFLSSRYVLMLASTILLMQVLFTPSGAVLWNVPIPWPPISITDAGLIKGILLTLRFLNVVLTGGLFVSTTEPAALVHALMRAGVPYRYGYMILLMLRFIPLFEEEMTVIRNAQKMRGLQLDKGGPLKLVRSIRYTVLPLVVSALSRADALEISMEGRAFGYKDTRTFLTAQRFSLLDRALMATTLAALIFMITGACMH
ncbi:MAG TPA: energy-coupling factor transporter transmembrane component T [Acidobacteriota bacterium]|nr:energy-coupling factor transporter transmembrane component T [Acidobacteriota bacterium]